MAGIYRDLSGLNSLKIAQMMYSAFIQLIFANISATAL